MTISHHMLVYNKIEEVLREASAARNPTTVRDIFESPAVQAVAKNEAEVRNKVNNLEQAALLTKSTVAESQTGEKRARIGYLWRQANRTVEDMKRNGKPPAKPQPPHAEKGITLVVYGVVFNLFEGLEINIHKDDKGKVRVTIG
jgi:hypothetical protein